VGGEVKDLGKGRQWKNKMCVWDDGDPEVYKLPVDPQRREASSTSLEKPLLGAWKGDPSCKSRKRP
jgi:hypothetical protein